MKNLTTSPRWTQLTASRRLYADSGLLTLPRDKRISGIPWDTRRGANRLPSPKRLRDVYGALAGGLGSALDTATGTVRTTVRAIAEAVKSVKRKALGARQEDTRGTRIALRALDHLGLIVRWTHLVALPGGRYTGYQVIELLLGWAEPAREPARDTLAKPAPPTRPEASGDDGPSVTIEEINELRKGHHAAMLGRYGVEPLKPETSLCRLPVRCAREVARQARVTFGEACGALMLAWCAQKGDADGALVANKHPLGWFATRNYPNLVIAAAVAELRRPAAEAAAAARKAAEEAAPRERPGADALNWQPDAGPL